MFCKISYHVIIPHHWFAIGIYFLFATFFRSHQVHFRFADVCGSSSRSSGVVATSFHILQKCNSMYSVKRYSPTSLHLFFSPFFCSGTDYILVFTNFIGIYANQILVTILFPLVCTSSDFVIKQCVLISSQKPVKKTHHKN